MSQFGHTYCKMSICWALQIIKEISYFATMKRDYERHFSRNIILRPGVVTVFFLSNASLPLSLSNASPSK